jgi:2-methylcitrate dehydratase PrpD
MTDFLSALSIGELPPEAAILLKLCLLDAVGCALGGHASEAGKAVLRLAGADCDGRHVVVGHSARTSAEVAALANGVLTHALVFDDLHRHAKLHPGVAVVPAVLAAAELAHVSGETFLSAMAAGYEATARVGVAIDMASHRKRGWRATGTAGAFGAAAAAARAFGLDADRFHNAFALAGAQASGNWAFQESAGMELYLAAGTAARDGLTAARLAAAGFRGAADPLMARDGGFFRMTSDAANPAILTDGLGVRYRLLDTCIKMYPTCHSSQTGIDAAINLRAKHGVQPADVERIEVRAGEITRLQCGWPYEPAPPPRLIFHMGYAMAVALKYGAVRPADFEGACPHDPELKRIALSTEVIADPELTAIYAERKPSDVTLFMKDGRKLRERVDYCRGEPENPPGADTVIAKFHDIGGGLLSRDAMDELAGRILAIEKERSLEGIVSLLSRRTQ